MYLDQAQLTAVFRAARKRPTRDRLLVALLYRFGCRISEALALQVGDVDLTRAQVTVQGAKRGTRLTYSIPPDLLTLLRRHRAPGPFLLASRQGERLGRTRAWTIVKQVFAEAGIPSEYGPHSLRHSLAVGMLDAGLQFAHVKDALRHASIRSTECYAALSPTARAGYARLMQSSPSIVKVH